MPDRQASDLHLVPGHPPIFRIHGNLRNAHDTILDQAAVQAMIVSILPESVREHLANHKDADFSVSLGAGDGVLRFRANVFFACGQMCACLRFIPNRIPDFDWMGFPRGLAERIIQLHNGLVIITGITDSGKTTTLAAVVQQLIRETGCRVLTVEEPIEFLFPSQEGSLVTQREVGVDVASFFDGLKYGLRQDPDVILVGEIRDRDTAQMALSAAETGHLILTTMHTQDAKGAVTRLVDLFPHEMQDDVRAQLSLSLRYVIAQHLLAPLTPGEKRVLALEVLVVNHPVAAAIRQSRVESLESAIQTGRRAGMVSLDDSLSELVSAKRIDRETARRYAKDPTQV